MKNIFLRNKSLVLHCCGMTFSKESEVQRLRTRIFAGLFLLAPPLELKKLELIFRHKAPDGATVTPFVLRRFLKNKISFD